MKNKTGRKSLDIYEDDPRVEEIWDEGTDGYWVALTPDYHWEECSTVHEWTVKELIESMKRVEKRDSNEI